MPLTQRFTLNDLRAARAAGVKTPFLTCYDYTTAGLMQEAGVSGLLVGDSAANVILGHPTTLPVSLSFMIEITAAVRRGAPLALLMADMPFGSYQGSVGRGVRGRIKNGETFGLRLCEDRDRPSNLDLVTALSDAGVAVIAHLGLRPQSVGVLGGYRFQGRTAEEAMEIVELATPHGTGRGGWLASGSRAARGRRGGRGINRRSRHRVRSGHPCHGSVIVTHDALGLTRSAATICARHCGSGRADGAGVCRIRRLDCRRRVSRSRSTATKCRRRRERKFLQSRRRRECSAGVRWITRSVVLDSRFGRAADAPRLMMEIMRTFYLGISLWRIYEFFS